MASIRTIPAGIAVLLFLLTSCATHKTYSPELSAPSRTGLKVNSPLLVSVIDGRVGSDDAESGFGKSLLTDLKDIYRTAVESHGFFSEVPEGRIALRIRVRRLSSNFGSKVVGATAVSSRREESEVSGVSSWGYLHAEARERSSTLSSTLVGEGWWVGGAWLDVELIDRRRKSAERIQLSLTEEVRKSNAMGYQTAESATQEAWRAVSSDLLYIVDEVLREM